MVRHYEENPVRSRCIVLIDDRKACVVPGCFGRYRHLDKNGMCPEFVWPLDHYEYAAQLSERGKRPEDGREEMRKTKGGTSPEGTVATRRA